MARKSVKTATFIGSLALSVLVAGNATARPDVRSMNCDQAKQLVKSKGAVVFTFTARTFDRVVKNVHYCSRLDEEMESVYVATRDQSRCKIGNRCTGEFPELFGD